MVLRVPCLSRQVCNRCRRPCQHHLVFHHHRCRCHRCCPGCPTAGLAVDQTECPAGPVLIECLPVVVGSGHSGCCHSGPGSVGRPVVLLALLLALLILLVGLGSVLAVVALPHLIPPLWNLLATILTLLAMASSSTGPWVWLGVFWLSWLSLALSLALVWLSLACPWPCPWPCSVLALGCSYQFQQPALVRWLIRLRPSQHLRRLDPEDPNHRLKLLRRQPIVTSRKAVSMLRSFLSPLFITFLFCVFTWLYREPAAPSFQRRFDNVENDVWEGFSVQGERIALREILVSLQHIVFLFFFLSSCIFFHPL